MDDRPPYDIPPPLTPAGAVRRALTELATPRVQTLAEQAEIVVTTLERLGFIVVRDRRKSADRLGEAVEP